MGMDWHSSGITTSVIGALKRGLGPVQDELGIHVCGGRGQHLSAGDRDTRPPGAAIDSLLPKLISGELRIQNAEKLAANAL